MKEKLIKIKLVRYKGMVTGKQWTIKSITNALTLGGFDEPAFKPGDLVSDKDAQLWVDSRNTYEVTVTE